MKSTNENKKRNKSETWHGVQDKTYATVSFTPNQPN